MGSLVGRWVAHFRIVERIGEGGMGVVYKATDEKLRRIVALKVLPESLAENPERRTRLVREARAAAAVTHPNIATVHDVGEADGCVYIAMEYVEGRPLRELLASGPLPIPSAVRIALQIARGLARAHQASVVHRDLKPDNVMVGEDEHVKLVDFGLAKQWTHDSATPSVLAHMKTATQVTGMGRLLGTPGYMSPEQARGKEVDGRTDVFAFGVVLFEMLTGQRPFVGESMADVLTAIARDTPQRASELNPGVSAELDRVVSRCLEKLPDARYANGQELVDALLALVPEPSVSEPSPRQRASSAPTASLLTPAAASVGVGVGRATAARRWLALLGLGAATVAAVFLAWRALSPGRAMTDGPPASSAAAVHGVAMTDHPAPKTGSAEAAAAYASGLQHLRDAEEFYGFEDFIRACTLDPAMAPACLRVVLYGNTEARTLRESFAAALLHRSALDERDRMLLQLAEVVVADPPLSRDEGVRRARAAADRFPDDAEAALLLGKSLMESPSADDGRAVLERALGLDPQFADALAWLSRSYAHTGDRDKELELLGRCLAITPSAGTCLRNRIQLDIDRGRCEDLEADARRLAVVEPRGHRTFELLAVALAARDAPAQAVREALASRVPLEPDDRARQRAIIQNTLWMATLAGDLDAAEKAARQWDDLYKDSLIAEDHDAPMTYLLDILEERGDIGRAIDAGEAYERRAHGWTGSLGFCQLRIAHLRRLAQRIDEATFRAKRDELVRRWVADGADAADLWGTLYVENVTTAADATEALSMMPEAGPLHLNALFEAKYLGTLYLLSGKPEVALPFLRRGAASCAILPNWATSRAYTIWWMRAHVLLGQALEQTGDPAGACGAYAVVLDRWKDATPRSVSLEKARARVRALGCTK